jgi:ABC-type glycerol-3-phosphate transport system permease component
MEGVPKESKSEFEWTLFIATFGMVLIALPALYMSISSARVKKEIITNQAYETATIVRVENIRKGRGSTLFIRFHYQYSYQNQVFKDQQDYQYQRYFVNFTKDKWRLVEGRYFPVILSSEDPSKHRILLFWSDFSKYSLSFPDSLKWSERVFYDKLQNSYPES